MSQQDGSFIANIITINDAIITFISIVIAVIYIMIIITTVIREK